MCATCARTSPTPGSSARTCTRTASTVRFDHAELFPFYAVCTDADVPVVMQAGTSGGLMPSECGQPIGIDRAALYFADTRFVLSHLGWPWENEAIAMALKFPNVYLGTGAYPPRHWGDAVRKFLRGPGRTKMMFGTNFPTVGHRHALAQIEELELDPATEARAARRHRASRVHAPLNVHEKELAMIGKVYAIPPQPPVEENMRYFDAGALRFGVEYRALDPESLVETYKDRPDELAEMLEAVARGRLRRRRRHRARVRRRPTGTSTCASTCSTTSRTTTTSTRPPTAASSTT